LSLAIRPPGKILAVKEDYGIRGGRNRVSSWPGIHNRRLGPARIVNLPLFLRSAFIRLSHALFA
jgi:hypothetical protein